MAKTANKKAKKTAKSAVKAKRRDSRKKLTPRKEARGLVGEEVLLSLDDPAVAALTARVRDVGGAPVGAYREPFSGKPLLVAVLPWKSVEPTPFQRDLSPTHTKRLASKIEETGVFLDPLIVVVASDGHLWTPNGRHRHQAAKVLGLRAVTALVSGDEELAFRILALNTEKAHNLKDRSLEVVRMARELAARRPRSKETDFEDQFEEPALLTLGIVYAENGRFAGSPYFSFLRKVDRFSNVDSPQGPSREGGLCGSSRRDRRAGKGDRRRPQETGIPIAVSPHLRRRPDQPRSIPSRQERRYRAADGDRRRAHTDGRFGAALRRGFRAGAGPGARRRRRWRLTGRSHSASRLK